MLNSESKYYTPKPLGVSKQDAAGLAELVRKASGQDNTNYCDLDLIVSRFGGSVFMQGGLELSDKEELGFPEASLLVNPDKSFEVFLNPTASFERNRFSLAHELGHYFLHFLYPLSNSTSVSDDVERNVEEGKVLLARRSFEQESYEWEANWFAAALLMPKSLFEREWGAKGKDSRAVAAAFRVSNQAAEVRARELGLCP